MSKNESDAAEQAREDDDDEPDEWDKRIFSTGCADENAKMTDCYFDKKDWRACKDETGAPTGPAIDWSASFHGLSMVPFAPEVAAKLMTPLDPEDVEVKPDGILYLPEIKYRRILNGAFGPGGWGLAPRGELTVGEKVVSREYALVVQGRFVGQARGECPYFGDDGVATAGEGCKSNALMRCCKDIGIASELWDPRFIRQFKQKHCREVWVEHVATKKRRQIWLRKDCPPTYPYALPSSSPARTPTR
ncbi:mitochondrial genome maintenance protein mgm101 [Grosmannia clavigera kw1407]|uniref:Mitochondrial genome maintenance protein MGM101 n=1 Tax=Grosmannia clavigera (strain kw1407 / UAMH 11150) TaxID=655863 RepID=F0XQG8_GROCL|nr:mitochondrial genome maintenance protein mgm101 [Grosmannia clavigera kw1407]EFX00068.1 mitochondrial genome maintenance protein mgm101 [Grosmannia clavigera kw1407]